MAGRITVSTLNDDTGVLATQNGMSGIAKAWVNFNGTGTPAIRASFNVSSITDNGTGNYTINFTTAMPDANYNIVSSAWSANSSMLVTGGQVNVQPPTTSLCRIRTNNGNALNNDTTVGDADATYVFVSIFR